MGKSKKDEEKKPSVDTSSANTMSTLRKHMDDWFEKHQHEEFISPLLFQNTYPQWGKYDVKSFRNAFYNVKKKIMGGE